MSEKKRIFVVESVATFFEVRLVEAESEEQAQKIAQHSDYNASKYLGTQFVNVYKYKEKDLKRFQEIDSYFFDGYAFVNDEVVLGYKKMDGTLNGNMSTEKIEL
jgi:hypothetical protein